MHHLFALTVGGQTLNPPKTLPQPGSGGTIANNALTLFISAGIVITILYIIWAAIRWITSGGDKQKIAAARAHLTWSIIGLIVILISFFIISIFSYVFGVQLLNINL